MFDEERVIEQAMDLFRQRGYEATSIRDLVAHVGVSSSSLYTTYGDKDAIFMLALERHSQIEKEMIRQQLAGSTNPRATIERLFADLIEQLLNEELPHGSLTLKAAVELGVNKPRVTAFLHEYLNELVRLFSDFLEEAADSGRLHLPEPAPDVARYLLFALFNLSFMAKVYPQRARLESYTRMVLHVLDGEAAGRS
ncbi:MAG: TetR/AcrR family transcriptional regulator [Chloroflexota bacterium]|nr:TetR/AcrR family transcriptional regulator [Chloroflexota bacterium]